MMDEYPEPYPAGGGIDMFKTWNMFGDPSVRVTNPSGMRVTPGMNLDATGPAGGPFEPETITYSLVNRDPDPVDVTISCAAPWIELSHTQITIPALVSADVSVSINSMAQGFGNGFYETDVSFVNTTTHDGDAVRHVTLSVGVPEQFMMIDLETDPGWILTGEWEYGQPTGLGGVSYGNPDPASGFTGDNVYGVNLQGDYSTAPGGPYYLTTAPLDCSQLFRTTLQFKRWLNIDYQPYGTATVEVSSDGTNWTSVWQNPGDPDSVEDDAWVEQEVDISLIADLNPTVQVRWGYEITDWAFAMSGWNIDDIEIWGVSGSSDTPTPFPTYTPTPEPTDTPTATPTDTPTPTATDTPIPPTETPVCINTGVSLFMPSTQFSPGDQCACYVEVCNADRDAIHNVPLFVILEISGFYFCAPSFSNFDYFTLTNIDPGLTQMDILPGFAWPDAGNGQGCWYAAITNSAMTEIVGSMDSWDFTWNQ